MSKHVIFSTKEIERRVIPHAKKSWPKSLICLDLDEKTAGL